MTTREQVEQEAEQLYPVDHLPDCECCPCFCSRCLNALQVRSAFIAGRTISFEQWHHAAAAAYKTVHTGVLDVWGGKSEEADRKRRRYLAETRAAFEAAGLVIEE